MEKVIDKIFKVIRFITGSAIILFFSILIFLALYTLYCSFFCWEDNIYGGSGRDTYNYFGNGRFEILRGESFILFDNKPSTSRLVVDSIEKYVEAGDFVYLIGYYTNDGIDLNNPTRGYFYYDLNTGEKFRYNNISEVPRYIILNYRTAEVRLYKTLDEVPEKDKKIFESWINPWCWFIRTCYKK